MGQKHICHLCNNTAVFASNNSYLELCEECFYSMCDDYDATGCEEETGMSFEEYYEFEEID